MRKLDRYIGSTVLLNIVVVAMIILGLDLLFAFIGELDDVEGNYSAMDALTYTLFTLPRRLYDMLPLAALVGCLIGRGTLASNSELTIMRAAGVSIARIIGAVMKPFMWSAHASSVRSLGNSISFMFFSASRLYSCLLVNSCSIVSSARGACYCFIPTTE